MFEALWKHDGWTLGLVDAPVAALLDPATLPPIHWLDLYKRGTFFADPFIIEQDGVMVCFCEELPYATNRGIISYIVLDERGRRQPRAVAAIVEPHHLSYPFILRHDGEIFCIPEGATSGAIVAYTARSFPDGWERKATLLDFPGVDPTIFAYDGRWWLFCTDGRSRWNSDMLAFFADHPFGPWTAHPRNPVLASPVGGRPGGRPFTVAGRTYRPVQNCSVRYGGSLLIAEIIELTPETFEERIVATVLPDARGPYPDGLHNACGENGLIAVDGNRYRFEARHAIRAVGAKLRRAKPP